MASDDVLERAKRSVYQIDHLQPCDDIRGTLCDLAAEVRALRKDSERLEWIFTMFAASEYQPHYSGDAPMLTDRPTIDAAMAKEAGE